MQHLQKIGGCLLQTKYFSLSPASRRSDVSTCKRQRSHLPYTLPSSVSRNFFICHSCKKPGGVFFPFWYACAQSQGQLSKRGEMGTGARGAPVPEVGLYVKIKRAQFRS